MGSISHHITPLVINSLGGGHTHTYTHRRQNQFLETRRALRALACSQHVPGLKRRSDGTEVPGMDKYFCANTLSKV